MGELIEKRIVQSRVYRNPNPDPIPDHDYDYTYPKTVYAALMKTMDDNSPTLEDELEAIYRLIRDKQNTVEAGIPGSIMTYTGVPGQIGSMEVVKAINTDPAQRSNQKVPSERAVGVELDLKVPRSEFVVHANDTEAHITDVERAKWNSMAPMSSLQAHMQSSSSHVTNAERTRWNNKADQTELEDHIFNMNNPHNVTAHQVGTYTRPEIDEMFQNIRESFFNYKNIYWDDRDGTAKLVDYQPANWNPNYVLQFGDTLPDVEDPSMMYFAVIPATDHETNETQDIIIWVKRPGLAWQEVGFQTMEVGDMIIRYPDTTMYVWVEGRFMLLFTEASDLGAVSENGQMWRPSVSEDGILTWTLSKEKTPPEPVVIKGKDGYTPIKGVDYDDGEDGKGVSIGGASGDILVKLSDENYDTTWKSLMDILNDLVIAGITFPEGLVQWKAIAGKPEWYDELGDNSDGFITQRAATRQFEIVATNIGQIQDQLGLLNSLKDDFYDHINDFNNPHRITPNMIGAPTIAQFTDHTQNFNNPHQVTPDQLGLGNVENTADLDKPISRPTQEALDELQQQIKTIQTGVDGLHYMTNAIWDDSKVTITFIFEDSSTLDVHIPITEVFNSIYYDKVEKELVIILPNGKENRIDISDLIITYVGSISDNIQVVVENDHAIKATIIPGTVGELEIAVSAHFRGSPTTTTQPVNDRSTRIATTEFVRYIVINNLISYETDRPLSANMGRILNERKADIEDVIQIINDMEGIEVIDSLDSTSTLAALSANMGRHLDLTKAPRVHTSPSGSTFGRATISVFGHTKAADTDPEMDGTVFRGTDNGEFARGDHRHPTDITRAPIHWPDPEHGQTKMTGEPKADTPPDASNDERIATTEWVRRNAVGVSHGYCSTESTNADKIVTLKSTYMDPVVFIRQIGSTIAIMFDNVDWSGNIETTLNVQDTGAAGIRFGGMPIVNGMIDSKHEHMFTFDGTYWQLINPTPGTGYGAIILGPGAASDYASYGANEKPIISGNAIVNQIAGINGYTLQGDGPEEDGDGKVLRVYFTIPYESRKSGNAAIEFAGTSTGLFAAQMGNGTLIDISDPKVIQISASSATVQFTLAEAYSSNSPCELVYKSESAWIKINEAS